MEDMAAVEDIVQADIFLYDIAIVEGSMIGELARRIVGEHSNTLRLLRYNGHICCVSNINVLFEAYCCPSCDQFLNKVGNLERHLTTWNEKVKHVFPKKVYQLRETLLDKLDSFNVLTPMTKNYLRT